MKNDYLTMLASLVLPAQILDYFLISGVEQSSQEIHISLDEKMNTKLSHDVHFESKGFMESVNVTDFLIRSFSRSGVVGGQTYAQVKVSVFPSTSTLWPKAPDTPKNLELF